jgi:D-alanyl-D-alanine carboxypeptidase
MRVGVIRNTATFVIFSIALITAINASASTLSCSPFDKILNEGLKKTGAPGISFAGRLPDGKIITCTAGVKNIKTKAAVTTKTLFQVGSVTKTFVATLVILDMQAGKFSLDSTIGDLTKKYGHWLPAKAEKLWQAVTVKQLLNMTSGIYSYGESKSFNEAWQAHPKKYWSTKNIISIAANHKSYFKPGKGWHYSDTNYVILGQLLQHISHQKLGTLIQDKLLKPYKISNIYYIINEYDASMLKRISRGYGERYIDRTNVNLSQARGAGAIVAQPIKLLKWLHLLFSGQIINKSLLTQMLTPYTKSAGVLTTDPKPAAYGLGLFRSYYPHDDGVNWGYGGATWGYMTWYDWAPATNILYVVSVNIGMSYGDNLHFSSGAILVKKIYPKLYQQLKHIADEQKRVKVKK